MQNRAYADFLSAFSGIAVAQRNGDRAKVNDLLANLADAKSRICTYGSPEVVEHLAEFIRAGATLQTEIEILSFSRLCMAMRQSAGMQKHDVFTCDISQILFNLDVKDVATPNKKS